MANPTNAERHIDRALSNMTVGWQQELNIFIATLLFPMCPVKFLTDNYYEYVMGDQLRNRAKKRAPKTESVGGGWRMTKHGLALEWWGYHEDVAWIDINTADEGIDVVKDAVDSVKYATALALEIECHDLTVGADIWDIEEEGDSTGTSADTFIQWNRSGSNPIEDFVKWSVKMQGLTGRKPNTFGCSRNVFETLRIHPEIVALYSHTQPGILTADLVAKALGIERILVAEGVVNSMAPTTDVTDMDVNFIWENEAVFLHLPKVVGKKTPSAGYTFYQEVEGFQIGVDQFEMRALSADRIESDFWGKFQTVCTQLGVYIKTPLNDTTS